MANNLSPTGLGQKGSGCNAANCIEGEVQKSGRGKAGEQRRNDPRICEVGLNSFNLESGIVRLRESEWNKGTSHKNREGDHVYVRLILC